MPQLRSFGLCVANTIVPTGAQVINDGTFSNGQKASREFLYAAVNSAGGSNMVDGNGAYARIQGGGGPVTVKADDPAESSPQFHTMYGRLESAPIGTTPLAPGTPAIVSDQPCGEQQIPDLNGPMSGPRNPSTVAYP